MRRFAAIAIVVLAASCGGGGLKAPPRGVLVHFGKATVAAEVVATSAGRTKGLMFRKQLEPDAGMLFLFPFSDSGGFWMKNTLIPLQIAYMRWEGERSFRVVAVLEMVPCKADPCKIYAPDEQYDATLEANKGWFDRHGVRKGSVGEAEGELPTPT